VEILVVPGEPPAYRFDPTRAESRLARLAVDQALQRGGGRKDLWTAREDRVTVPGSRYIDWFIPGLIGLNIMGTSLWSVGYAIVQSRTRKLLKRLVATPMDRGQYLLAHMLARLVFLGLEVAPLLVFGWIVFGVPVRGSLAALIAIAFLGAASFGGIGLLIASRARTVEAVSGLMNAVSVPMWVLSGVFFSSANFPASKQPFIRALPLTALNEAMRAVMLDGDSSCRGPPLAVLAAWGVVSYGLRSESSGGSSGSVRCGFRVFVEGRLSARRSPSGHDGSAPSRRMAVYSTAASVSKTRSSSSSNQPRRLGQLGF
jgi:ABC-type multidrug transport system permease subunit